MTDKQHEMFRLAWDLVLQQSALLFEVHSLNIQMLDALKSSEKPNLEQFATWDEARVRTSGVILELSATLEELSQHIQPSRFDA